jgi:hypothetical protein
VSDNRKAMTLILSVREMAVLDELALKKDLTKTEVLRQALRLYQLVDARLSEGRRMFFDGDEFLPVGCGGDD